MLTYDQFIDEPSLTMMRRVLDAECFRRAIRPKSSQGEELALIIMDAFRAGMTKESELMDLVRSWPR